MSPGSSPGARARRFCLFSTAAVATCTLLLMLGMPGRAGAQTTYTSSGGISIDPSGTNTTIYSGTSSIAVSDAATVTNVAVTLNDLYANETGDWSAFSVAQTSFVLAYCPTTGTCREFMLLGSTGDAFGGGTLDNFGSGINVTLEDSAASMAPGCDTPGGLDCPAWAASPASQTYKPSSYWEDNVGVTPSAATLGLPSPYSSYSLAVPKTDGTQTLNNEFNVVGQGTWTLIVANDLNEGVNTPISLSSWSLTLTYAVAPSTTTTVSSSLNPVFTAAPDNSVTLTATVTSSGSPVSTGTVDFEADNSTISGCGAQAVSGGTATCTTSFAVQGDASITAAYTSSGAYAPSTSSSLSEIVVEHSTQSGNLWCNPGSISVGENGSPGPLYPSLIQVSGYGSTQTVSTVQVQLNGVTGYIDAQHLLVAPGGAHDLDFFDGSWYNNNQTSAIDLTFDDTAGQYPAYGAAPVAGSYEASDENQTSSDSFPSATIVSPIPQVPGTVNYGYDPREPDYRGPSTNTFENEFNGAPANGFWALYAFNQEGTPETIGGGWCIELTPNSGTSTTTTLTSSQQQAAASQAVNLTATVTPAPSSGTVTFLDNGLTPSGASGGNNTVSVNASGQAVFPTGVTSYTEYNGVTNADVPIYEGDHNFTADYSGSSSDDPSNSPTFWQRFDNASTVTSSSNTQYSYCNAGSILSPANETGAFFPNPSNVFVTSLPGTINTAGVTLTDLSSGSGETTSYYTQSLLKGPTGAAIDFFSSTGPSSGSSLTTGNYSFSDSAGSEVPQTEFAPGAYQPTSYGSSANTYTSSPFYSVPASIQYAAPHGSTTFTSLFGNTSGNGTWSLFFNASSLIGADIAVSNGWCMNFTENTVTVDASLSHTGDGASGDFVQGEQNAAINVGISNQGTGSTGDPVGGNHNPMSVVDTLPSGLTYASANGTGWSCTNSVSNPQLVSCTNDGSVAQGDSYAPLTILVNVADAASGSLPNSITVSGAGAAATSASDLIHLDNSAMLALTKSHTGTFAQGSTGQWTLTVSNIAANGSTSGTVTVLDTLPSGYTLSSWSSSGGLWTCTGTNSVSCTATPGIAGGSSSTITLTVNVPANSPTSVSNTASAYGGGDQTHTSPATAAISNTDSVSVVQVPASITIDGSQTQSATIGTAFGSLAVTVKDAAGVAIPNYSSVTFTASTSGSGAGGTFSTGTNTIPVTTSGSGVADPGTFTANSYSGTYTVAISTTTGSVTAPSFTLTNTAITPALTWSPASTIIFGSAGANVLNASINCTSCGSISYTATPAGGGTTVPITSTAGLAAGAYNIVASFNPSTSGYNPVSATQAITISGESVWVVAGAGGLSEVAGNGYPISPGAYTGANAAAAIDSTGNVWSVGSGPLLSEINQVGTVENSITSGGGLNTPAALAIDGNSQVWVVNGNSSVSLFSNAGAALSPSAGFTDPSLSSPAGIAVDLSGSVWIANKGNNSLTRVLGAAAPTAPLSTAAANNTTGAKP